MHNNNPFCSTELTVVSRQHANKQYHTTPVKGKNGLFVLSVQIWYVFEVSVLQGYDAMLQHNWLPMLHKNTVFSNIRNQLPTLTASYQNRMETSATPLQKASKLPQPYIQI